MVCAVFSADMLPTGIVTLKKAIKMALRGKHFVVETHPVVVRSCEFEIEVPKVMICKQYHKLPPSFYGPAKYSDDLLYIRDQLTCQYCGKTKLKKKERWTKDHIQPASRGGKNTWENLVLSCSTCNEKKDNRTPQEAGMKLLKEPKAPTRWDLEFLKK